MIARTLSAALLAAAALSAAPALADEGDAIATAPAKAPNPAAVAVQSPVAASSAAPPAVTAPGDVGRQIADYLASSPAVLPVDETPGVISGAEPDRKMHGEVSVSVGNHGYRDFYARSDMPLGKTGQLSIAVQESRGRGWYGPGWYGYGHGYGRRSLGLGFAFGDGVGEVSRERCSWRYGEASSAADGACRTISRGPL